MFLDDLGINLKPARAMGMTTIKVADPHEALAELPSSSPSTHRPLTPFLYGFRSRTHRPEALVT